MCPYLCHLLSCCLLIQSVIFSVSCFLFPVFLTESEPPLLSSWTVLPFFYPPFCLSFSYLFPFLSSSPPSNLSSCPSFPHSLSLPNCPSSLPLIISVLPLLLLSVSCFCPSISSSPSFPYFFLSLPFFKPYLFFSSPSSLLVSSFPSFCPCLLPSFLPSVLSLSHFSSHPSSSLVSSDSKSRPGSDSSPL